MAQVRRLLAVEADIEHALSYTLGRFGVRKYDEYAVLIEEALVALSLDPHAGKAQPEIAPEAWTLHIRQRGRKARHLLVYRIPDADLVEVLALAYDGMDLPRLWRARGSGDR
jgi:plasmid stabilization system protein ParE